MRLQFTDLHRYGLYARYTVRTHCTDCNSSCIECSDVAVLDNTTLKIQIQSLNLISGRSSSPRRSRRSHSKWVHFNFALFYVVIPSFALCYQLFSVTLEYEYKRTLTIRCFLAFSSVWEKLVVKNSSLNLCFTKTIYAAQCIFPLSVTKGSSLSNGNYNLGKKNTKIQLVCKLKQSLKHHRYTFSLGER